MNRVLSVRLDEAAIEDARRVSKRLGLTMKEFLESAIRLRAREIEQTVGTDVWQETCGAWARDETVTDAGSRSRKALEASFSRHHRRRASKA